MRRYRPVRIYVGDEIVEAFEVLTILGDPVPTTVQSWIKDGEPVAFGGYVEPPAEDWVTGDLPAS